MSEQLDALKLGTLPVLRRAAKYQARNKFMSAAYRKKCEIACHCEPTVETLDVMAQAAKYQSLNQSYSLEDREAYRAAYRDAMRVLRSADRRKESER